MPELLPEVEELVTLVGKPEKPNGGGDKWDAVERGLGLTFPADFKQLVQVFGTGPWAGSLKVFSPFAEGELMLELAAMRALPALHEIRRNNPEDVKHAIYPEPKGLFPWGITDKGATLCWLTEGDSWKTIVVPPGSPAFEVYDLSAPALIRDFLKGKLESSCLLEPFEGEAPIESHKW